MANFILPSASSSVAILIFQATSNFAFGSPLAKTATDGSLDLIVDPEEIQSQAIPPPFAINGEWTNWETWEASPDVIKSFPYRKLGHDLDGLPVTLVEFGKWDYRGLSKGPEEKVEEFRKYFEQLIMRKWKEAELNNGEGMVLICDWDGFSLSKYASAKAIKLAMKLFAGLVRLNDFLKYGFYVNVNFAAETFINTMRPFTGEYLEKFEMCGTRIEKCKPSILKQISADQLPPKYGGSSGR